MPNPLATDATDMRNHAREGLWGIRRGMRTYAEEVRISVASVASVARVDDRWRLRWPRGAPMHAYAGLRRRAALPSIMRRRGTLSAIWDSAPGGGGV